MKQKPEQLLFDIPIRTSLSIDDFVVGKNNKDAVKLVEIWPKWPGHCLVLIGSKASGKSHLARIWLDKSNAILVNPDTDSWEKLTKKGQSILVENAHLVENEEGLFHLYNWTKETGAHFLLTSLLPPSMWNIKLPDLSSRLKASSLASIGLPDDKLLGSILSKHFADRQILVEDKVISYLVPRIERTFESASKVSKDLDGLAFKANKKITTVMVRKYLEHQMRT